MLNLWVIALFVAVVLRESLDEPLLAGWLSDRWIAIVTIGGMTLIAAVTHLIVARCTGVLRRRGSWRAVVTAEAAVAAARWAAVALHLFAILALGWLDTVRHAVGDVVLLDELITLLPALLVFACGWWAIWPMEKLLHGVTTLRDLDTGKTVYPIPGRARFVVLNLRHHVIVWLTPLFLIVAWAEVTRLVTAALADHGGAFAPLRDTATRAAVNGALELAGVALVFLVLGPLAMRFVWDTVRLDPGPLRERLERLCRLHHVRVSDLLVWRTHGTMINGAVLGLTPAFRYVLLTDALLDSLPEEEVEAVMAHEVAHVRHRHIIWLAVVIAVTVAAAAWAAEIALAAAGWGIADETLPEWLALAIAMTSFAGAMLMFGLVSRRFEWQADAFAAAHMSKSLSLLTHAPDPSPVVTRDGAAAMADALRSVARLNHVPMHRSSWRHGSIGARIDRLSALIDTPLRHVPIDRTSRAIKRAALAAAACLCAAILLQFALGG